MKKARKNLNQVLAGVKENQQVLANFSILTCYNAGYAGPFKDGVYSEVSTTQLALQQGVRGFFLTIDSDKNGRPVLVNRDINGFRTNLDSFLMNGNTPVKLLGGDPGKVFQTIADSAFSNSNDPIMIFLYFQKTPSSSSPEYIRFLSKIAKMLMPLRQYHLRMTSRADFTRQYSTDSMLLYPIKEYEKKVLIYTNVDTSMFRKKKYQENQDLDYWVNLRFHTNSTSPLGMTQKLNDSSLIRGEIEPISYFTQIPKDRIEDIVSKIKINAVVAISQTESIALKDAEIALDKLGVQILPFDIFNNANDPISDLFKDASFRIKPEAIRYTIPEPIKIAPQNPKMNSNQGIVVAPSPPIAGGPPPRKITFEQLNKEIPPGSLKCDGQTPPEKCMLIVDFVKENPKHPNAVHVLDYCTSTNNTDFICKKIFSMK